MNTSNKILKVNRKEKKFPEIILEINQKLIKVNLKVTLVKQMKILFKMHKLNRSLKFQSF
jgi:hypothetical protein